MSFFFVRSIAVQGSGGGGDEFAHGDSVTITGSGFGSMPTFAFAGGSQGVLETTSVGVTPDSGVNTSGPGAAGFNWIRFNNTGSNATIFSDSTRGKVLSYDFGADSGEVAQEYRFASTIALGGKVMVKYHGKYDLTDTDPGQTGPGSQIKFARLQCGTSDISDTNHNMVFTFLVSNYMHYVNSLGGTGAETNYLGDSSNFPARNNVWSRVEKKITAPTSQGASNGRIIYRAIRIGGTVGSYYSNTTMNSNPDAERHSAYTWQNWIGNGMIANRVSLDDHYVSMGTFKCVELWNTDTPSTATLREIQEPTSWSDTSITVRLNRGGLADGNYKLVVLDDSESDVVLASRDVTLVT